MTAHLAAHSDTSAIVADAPGPDGPGLRIITGPTRATGLHDRVSALGGQVGPVDQHWSITVPDGKV